MNRKWAEMIANASNPHLPCFCGEIRPDDRPCIVCESWRELGETPPPEVGALFGKVPTEIDKEDSP